MVLETQKRQSEASGDFAIERNHERRRRRRAALESVVHFSRAGSMLPISGKIRNISSQGLYCLVPEPLESGERLECMVVMPAARSGRGAVLCLKCQARLLRVDALAPDKAFGVALLIEEYTVVHFKPFSIDFA